MDSAKRFISLRRTAVTALIQGKCATQSSSAFAGRSGSLRFQSRFFGHVHQRSFSKRFSTIALGFTTGTVISTLLYDNCFTVSSKLVVSCDSAGLHQGERRSEHFEGYEGELPKTKNCMHVKLYQYQNCPFCCKVRAFLDYYGIEYERIEVNPLLKTQIKFSNYRKVPIVIVDDKQQVNSYLYLNI